jgi:hypothetical protein
MPAVFTTFSGFGGNKRLELGLRRWKQREPQVGKTRCYVGLAERGIDLLVECLHDLCGDVRRCQEALSRTGLIAGHWLSPTFSPNGT